MPHAKNTSLQEKRRNSQQTQLINTQSSGSVDIRKICHRCKKPIFPSNNNNNNNNNNSNKNNNNKSNSVLKALGHYYHEHCFTCHDCSTLLKPKYFPYKDETSDSNEKILLCQYHYFKRNNLLCHVCDNPLRGLYFTAFGERYDEEHFSCIICKTPCGVKKCFMFNDQLYCKYHFLKYFSKRCNGCHYPISDQYIEFPRGNDIYCWHPECYGIHKYWHVDLSAETLGLPGLPKTNFTPPIDANNFQLLDTKPTPIELEKQMQAFNFILTKTWTTLYRFEEETASCISDMFQYLTSHNQLKGIDSTALFVLKIECLFKALDMFEIWNPKIETTAAKNIDINEGDNIEEEETDNADHSNKSKSSKYPRNLTTKIMIYLQLLRKLGTESKTEKVTLSSFMSVITGLAHFLKLITRHALNAALESDKKNHSANVLLKFLREVEKNELFERQPFSNIRLSINTTDCCKSCNRYIQKECIQFHDYRWHLQCFKCSSCHKLINVTDVTDTTYNKELNRTLCSDCSIDDPGSVPGFKFVTKLSQLIFLLKIALIRSKAVMEIQMKSKISRKNMGDFEDDVLMQQTYVRTLNDIKRLKSRRESVKVSRNKQEARRSRIMETSEIDVDKLNLQDQKSLKITVETPSSSSKNVDNNFSDKMFDNTKTLTLDDISRIVAAEQARELRPNAFAHFKKLKDNDEEEMLNPTLQKSGIYYSELMDNELALLQMISLALLKNDSPRIIREQTSLNDFFPTNLKHTKEPQPSKFWSKMKVMLSKEQNKAAVPNVEKVFGTPLEVLAEKWGVESDLGIGPTKVRIPIIVDELLSTLRNMDMSVEGIFRKNGNIRKLREISNAFDSNINTIPDLSKENVMLLSALLKKFLRELPDPLLTRRLYQLWINAAKCESESDKRRSFFLIYSMLPIYNRNTTEVLLSFLYWTSSFSHIENEMGSKMDIHNLSTVIAPNVLYDPTENSVDIEMKKPLDTNIDNFAQNEGASHFLAIEVIDFLVIHNEELSTVPKILIDLLREIQSAGIDDFISIENFIQGKIKKKLLNLSDFTVAQAVRVKNSTSLVIQSATEK
ncbi:GTPase-activating protein LRG1 NDAI_0H04020 [Naumovozyma dairenensis CBS 421]|uniref:Uncharacterized protein n=1 Tax=Naumovozyma dairenensis (strain ATCC 10597 / BCRC 20456 / CBS 421 / NBRC 0211 / NRRL Y-12639) TaxID=1071378 RepID=G0WFL4_NAUDC|nr:hypothetical protein NDAI_0H04020 [Naumovozyma dairenensis CBS 421]CCD26575.1 hypothetical protein NDAI_0H04020 [Naumovozyma dairenensis CBS 421]